MVENDAINQDKRCRIKSEVEENIMRQALDMLSLQRLGDNHSV